MTPQILIFTLNRNKQSNKGIRIFQLGANIKVSRLKSSSHGFYRTGHKPVICNYTIPQCMMNGFQYGGDCGGGDDDGWSLKLILIRLCTFKMIHNFKMVKNYILVLKHPPIHLPVCTD